jgi:hypothetical protein
MDQADLNGKTAIVTALGLGSWAAAMGQRFERFCRPASRFSKRRRA